MFFCLDNRIYVLYNRFMTLWQYLQANGFSAPSLQEEGLEDGALLRDLETLAKREGRTPDEVILSLLNRALEARRSEDCAHHNWEMLSAREKQVGALICGGLTNRQIAARLVISPETVKTHVRHILRKFGIHSRRELLAQLKGWDLREWGVTEDANGNIL